MYRLICLFTLLSHIFVGAVTTYDSGSLRNYTGPISNSCVVGSYPGISGVGVITSGTWQGSLIQPQYIVGGIQPGATNLSFNGIFQIFNTNTLTFAISVTPDQVGSPSTNEFNQATNLLNNSLLRLDQTTPQVVTNGVPVFSNGISVFNTTIMAGSLNGTNGVYFTQSGTNYWILLK